MQPRLAGNSAPIHALLRDAESVILGKRGQIRLAIGCLLAQGHLLIEDLPGVGKTTLAHLLAKLFGLQFQRIQFTSDLLPADITGASIYDRESGSFHFHPGPVFCQLVLADEVNRATPKTQSALLEAMEERQVTVEGEPRVLPEPFFVVATQNPGSQIGTFPLPESQLDRFLMRIQLGYPDRAAEHDLLRGRDRRRMLNDIQPAMDVAQLLRLQAEVEKVHVADPVVDYVQALMEFTRSSDQFHTGLSPRAGLALLRAARAWALLEDRDAVIPEDIQAVFVPVACHRLHPAGGTPGSHDPVQAAQVLEQVAVP
ncbi:MAG: AAA family ATPase [Ectothiorhodospiraceae bacterium]|nr:AAA family ATPase [Ectothiorhodospiraceae bacterium]